MTDPAENNLPETPMPDVAGVPLAPSPTVTPAEGAVAEPQADVPAIPPVVPVGGAAATAVAGVPDPRTAIWIRGLTKRFGDFTAVDAIDLDVRKGEIFGFLGPNGSGKTTTIRMLCASIAPTSGTARILGNDVVEDPEAVRRSIGYMSQKFALFEDLTVDENLRFYAGIYALPADVFAEKRRYVLEMADLVGREREMTANLSVGWKQRLALGCATIHEPELLFLDEPTSGVDPTARRQFWELLYELAEQGVTLFVTTHYMEEASHCGRLAFIYDGRIIATGSPQQIRAEHADDCILELEVDDVEGTLAWLDQAEGVVEAYLSGALLHANMGSATADCGAAFSARLKAAGFQVTHCERVEPTIEDVFVHLVSRQRALGLSHERPTPMPTGGSQGAVPTAPSAEAAIPIVSATVPVPGAPDSAFVIAPVPELATDAQAPAATDARVQEPQAEPTQVGPVNVDAKPDDERPVLVRTRSRQCTRHTAGGNDAADARLHEPARDSGTVSHRPESR